MQLADKLSIAGVVVAGLSMIAAILLAIGHFASKKEIDKNRGTIKEHKGDLEKLKAESNLNMEHNTHGTDNDNTSEAGLLGNFNQHSRQ